MGWKWLMGGCLVWMVIVGPRNGRNSWSERGSQRRRAAVGCGAKGALSFTGTPEKRYLRLTGLMGGWH